MKTWIILIILGVSQILFCNTISNLSNYDLYSLHPVSLYRIKRNSGNPEYTRWRSNEEVTHEFIVKVLDDDIIAPNTKKIAAINIEPKTKGGEKIIVGGALVPQRSNMMSSTADSFKDYTRFVPPTTIPVTNIGGDLLLAAAQFPKTDVNLSPIRGINRLQHSQRDDSPPASPQFLARTPNMMARQYAPIASVSFSKKTTLAPLTPPLTDLQILRKTFTLPSRTAPSIELDIRSQSAIKKIHSLDQDEVAPVGRYLTRTTFVPHLPERTSMASFEFSNSIEPVLPTTGKIHFESDVTEKIQNTEDKDLDASYNILFYRDEDNDQNEKKDDTGDLYLEKTKIQEKKVNNKFNASEHNAESINTTDSEAFMYFDENQMDENENITEKTTKNNLWVTSNTNDTITLIKDKVRDKRRPICSMIKLRQLNFNSPRTLPEIVEQLKQWSEESPVATWVDITNGNYTTMENPIYMMIVDDPSNGQIVSAKQTVMIVAGIQGRDHHAVAAAVHVLYQLIERSEAHADLLSKYRFWIIPVFNPDGYDYSMKFPHRREWKKNLRQKWDSCKGRESCYACEVHGLRCIVNPCYGVNLDRNFEYQWIPAEELRTEHPCGDLYAGTRQLSEPETQALTQYLHEQHSPLYTFIAFKEGDILGIMYPYSHTKKKRAFDHIYRQRASRAASAAYSISGRPYMAGQTSEFLPLYAGGMEDWVDGHLGVDNTYTIMMFRPTDTYNSKLITERVVHEAYAAVDTLLLESIEPRAPQITVITKTNNVGVVVLNYFITILIIFILKFFD